MYFFLMKKLTSLLLSALLLISVNSSYAENDRSLLEKLLNRDLPGGAASKRQNKPNIEKEKKIEESKKVNYKCEKVDDTSLLEKILRRDLPGGSGIKKKCIKSSSSEASVQKKKLRKTSIASNDISLYTGTFDVLDKEGDDQTTLFGLEHKNENLFRNTVLGKFSPITGGFMTGNSSVYLYTGVEGQYNIGPLKILPSFAPGYYEKGDGKDLGSILEFKSEVRIGLDILENSKIGYSYSHISNNDWGERNPGTDNQQITFSKIF
jgi:lipid A 3-O-deacylase